MAKVTDIKPRKVKQRKHGESGQREEEEWRRESKLQIAPHHIHRRGGGRGFVPSFLRSPCSPHTIPDEDHGAAGAQGPRRR